MENENNVLDEETTVLKMTEELKEIMEEPEKRDVAEAEAMMFLEGKGGEHKTEAVNALKALWSKRIDVVPSSYLNDGTAANLVRSVRNERRRELCFEDHRWFDLRRQGMPSINHKWMGDHGDSQITTFELTKNDPMYTLQIPENVMIRNDKLIQNPSGPIRVSK